MLSHWLIFSRASWRKWKAGRGWRQHHQVQLAERRSHDHAGLGPHHLEEVVRRLPDDVEHAGRHRRQEVVADVGRRYDSNHHLDNTAEHTGALRPEFVDRFAVVGPPEVVVSRLRELHALGVDRFVITGPSFRSDREHATTAGRLLGEEVLPALRAVGS